MALKRKTYTLLGLLLLAACYLGGDYLVRFRLILPGFSTLEQQEARKDLSAIVDTIRREAYHIKQIASDWAAWDDMYRFAQDGNEDFIRSNFQWESLRASGIDLIFVCDLEGRIVWGGAQDPVTGMPVRLQDFPEQGFPKTHPLLLLSEDSEHNYGIMLTEHDPLLLSSLPILTSERRGPKRGTLLMGRFLQERTVRELIRQTRIPFSVMPLNSPALSAEDRAIIQQVIRANFISREVDDTTLTGYSLINDIGNRPALLVSASLPREIMLRGKKTARLTSLAIFLAFTIVCVFVVVWVVLFRAESRKRQEEISRLVDERTRELRESEERLRTLINATPDIICLKDGEGRWLLANKADLELFHLQDVDYFGKKDSELAMHTHPVFIDAFNCCEESDERAWTQRTLSRTEEVIATPEEQVKVFDIIKIPTFHANGRRKSLIVFGRDITEQKVLQERLRKAEKMEAIGITAGGVAHDLNNILSGIVGYPELLLMQLPENSPMRAPLESIRESGRRASAIVADLLTIVRGVASSRVPANLNRMISEYLQSPEHEKIVQLYPEVEIRFQPGEDLRNILCSPVHIKKCLMNIVLNGAEAIEGAGSITISTGNRRVDGPVAGFDYVEEGDYAVVTVADTGSGISAKDIKHIFEPFYTRKYMGRSGTGLGLSVVWNTIKDHGGYITVESNSRGTCFTLYFPVTDREEVTARTGPPSLEGLYGKGEKILVIDDEVEQRRIAASILSSLNYRVETVASGEEALAYLQKHRADLLLLDMLMEPGMDGSKTYEEVLKIHPGQKVVIVSGFTHSTEVSRIQELGGGIFIKKPYTINELGTAVKETLEREQR